MAAVLIPQNLLKSSPSAECSMNRPIRLSGPLWRRAGWFVSGRWWAGVTVEMGAVVQCLYAQLISFDQRRIVTFHMRDWSWRHLDLSADRCYLSASSVLRWTSLCGRNKVRKQGCRWGFQGLATSSERRPPQAREQHAMRVFVILGRQMRQRAFSVTFLENTTVMGYGWSSIRNFSPGLFCRQKYRLRLQLRMRTWGEV